MNILFIFTDQMHRFAMRCMGTPDIHTPNLDRLAGRGVLFRNAYSNCPICTPFRINLFTGLYTHQTDTFGNEKTIPDDCQTLAKALNERGYRTSYVGKWHIGGKGNCPIPQELRGGFTDFIGYQCYNGFVNNVCFYDEKGTEHRFDRHRTDVTTDLAIERLEAVAHEPFAMFVSYQAPHYPVQPSPQFEALYQGKDIRRRPNCSEVDPYTPTWSPLSPRPPDSCPDYQRYGNDLGEYLRLYYGMVSQVDAGVGRLLNALERLQLQDETVVVFTSDHGDMQGSHGLKNKCLSHEESSGIPLIVSVPNGAQGVTSDALVSGVDFFPACMDYAGAPSTLGLPGMSFAPITRGEADFPARPVFSELRAWKMVRDGNLKLTVEGDDLQPTLLFDLASDPFEQCNLVEDPQHKQHIELLRRLIVDWQSAGNGRSGKAQSAR